MVQTAVAGGLYVTIDFPLFAARELERDYVRLPVEAAVAVLLLVPEGAIALCRESAVKRHYC